ncbi:hypothetical protein [Comamonas jiangduensis]|uniref:hypothetical protein n=1 Tax=Comamonas jiangduensis TaxID=1194168 RepID=UPI0028B03FF6|nr:hypothetical protein [Comamonas jiangduensis]
MLATASNHTVPARKSVPSFVLHHTFFWCDAAPCNEVIIQFAALHNIHTKSLEINFIGIKKSTYTGIRQIFL